MLAFVVPSVGKAGELTLPDHEAWNRIVADERSKAGLNMNPVDSNSDVASVPVSDWLADPEAFGATRWRLVVHDNAGFVLAVVELAAYPCDAESTDPGAAVDIVVHPNEVGRGRGTATLSALEAHLRSLHPDVHVFADVCTTNEASQALVAKLGWKVVADDVPCNIFAPGLHDCDQAAHRFCGHASH